MTSPSFGVPANLPVGTVMAWFTDTAPSQWLFVEGQTGLSRTTYAALWALWGSGGSNILGAGDGTTTFDMPDHTEHVIAGKGAAPFNGAVGSKIGANTDAIADHTTGVRGAGAATTTSGFTHAAVDIIQKTVIGHWMVYVGV